MFLSKKLKEARKEIKQNSVYTEDSDGRALINVKADNCNEIFSEFDYDSGEKLNPALSDFVWDKARFVPVGQDIKVRIYTSDKVNEKDVEFALRNNFKKDYKIIASEKRKNMFFSLTMFILGLLTLGFLFLSYKFFRNDYLDVILEIVAWVFIWEAVDAFFLERSKIRHKQLTLLKLYTAEVEVKRIKKEAPNA